MAEEYTHLGMSSGGGGGGGGGARFSFLNLPLPMMAGATAAPLGVGQAMSACSYYPPEQRQRGDHLHAGPSQVAAALHSNKASTATEAPLMEIPGGAGDAGAIKNKLMSHPQYTALLAAYLDCQKIGAPQDVVDRLSFVAGRLEAAAPRCHQPESTTDPELDQFMEAYCNMLVKYREELTRPIQEAMDYLKRVEAQLNSLTDGASPARVFFNADGAGSMEDDGADGGEREVDPQAEDKELKYQLLKKYSGYLSSLRQEFSKKKKKGKLPKEARQKLLNWWELHYKWPYPSEAEKIALAESTGLDQKQINNWFINQRKRHWKPSEDMPLFMMEGYPHPHVGAAAAAAAGFYMDVPFMADGLYRLG